MTARLTDVLAAIDAANACDPNLEPGTDGCAHPAALVYGRRMSATLGRFAPDASDALRIAVRGQHIERWTRPRADYPAGRAGYLQWRRDAAVFHATRVTALMAAAGMDDAQQARVTALIRKLGLKTDAEAQTLEDVACLVFFEHYALPFAAKHTAEDVARIVDKTAAKMSAHGRQAALHLALPDAIKSRLATV